MTLAHPERSISDIEIASASVVAELIDRSADANAALMRGDIDTYRTLIAKIAWIL
jgi:hypothetical protein